MSIAYRLKLDPIMSTAADGASLGIAGASLSFQQLGKGRTAAKRDAPKAARITFQVSLSKRARGERETETLDIDGSIEGTLAIDASSGTPFFIVAGQPSFAEPLPKTTDASSEVRPRSLELKLKPSHFRFFGEPIRLFLPKDLADGFHYAELHAEVELSGSVDAAQAVNDVLDLPLLPRRRLLLSLVDQQGAPIADQALELSLGGETVTLTTNTRGEVSVENPPCESVKVRIPDVSPLRDAMKDRWRELAVGGRLREGDRVRILHLTEPIAPLEVPLGRTQLSVQPSVTLARLRGTFFDPARCFFLPAGVSSLKDLVGLHEQTPHCELLLVAHTEASGKDADDRELSLARAEVVKAYLSDDAAAWLDWYEPSKPARQRWGQREDKLMAQALIPHHVAADTDDWATAYREWHNTEAQHSPGWQPLDADGPWDASARKQLILDYMALDGTTLPEDASVTTHGCGSSFPIAKWGERADGPHDDEEPLDMRLEFFLFERTEGILPVPSGNTSKADSTDYPEWLRRADRKLGHLLSIGVVQIWLHDAFGRRMGADHNATDAVSRERGAPYCLVIPPDQTRVGYADAEGLLVERDVTVKSTCTLYWGAVDDDPEPTEDVYLNQTDDPLAKRYRYCEQIFLDTMSDPEQPDIGKILHNLGYVGSEGEMRLALADDHGKNDDDFIIDLHQAGLPKPSAAGGGES